MNLDFAVFTFSVTAFAFSLFTTWIVWRSYVTLQDLEIRLDKRIQRLESRTMNLTSQSSGMGRNPYVVRDEAYDASKLPKLHTRRSDSPSRTEAK